MLSFSALSENPLSAFVVPVTYSITISDNIIIQDSTNKQLNLCRSISDSIVLSDNLLQSTNYHIMISDNLLLFDNLLRSINFHVTISDIISIFDDIELSLSFLFEAVTSYLEFDKLSISGSGKFIIIQSDDLICDSQCVNFLNQTILINSWQYGIVDRVESLDQCCIIPILENVAEIQLLPEQLDRLSELEQNNKIKEELKTNNTQIRTQSRKEIREKANIQSIQFSPETSVQSNNYPINQIMLSKLNYITPEITDKQIDIISLLPEQITRLSELEKENQFKEQLKSENASIRAQNRSQNKPLLKQPPIIKSTQNIQNSQANLINYRLLNQLRIQQNFKDNLLSQEQLSKIGHQQQLKTEKEQLKINQAKIKAQQRKKNRQN